MPLSFSRFRFFYFRGAKQGVKKDWAWPQPFPREVEKSGKIA